MKLINPLTLAWTQTGDDLFRPFRAEKWFRLGFSAWLASFLFGVDTHISSMPSGSRDDLADLHELTSWGLSSWLWIVAGIGVILLVFTALLMWLGCRGQFMFVDNLVHQRADISAPWKKFQKSANSLFSLFFFVQFILLLMGILIAMGGLITLWPHLLAQRLSLADCKPLILAGVGYLTVGLAINIVLFFIREFGLLWMYRHGGSAWQAAKKIGEFACEHPWGFILYLLVRVVMEIVFISATLLVACITCCIALLPYLGSVVTLPLSVFRQRYIIECFAQLGQECDPRNGEPLMIPPVLPPGD